MDAQKLALTMVSSVCWMISTDIIVALETFPCKHKLECKGEVVHQVEIEQLLQL